MSDFTSNYNLIKPIKGEGFNVEHQNGNMGIIDLELKNVNDKTDGIINKYGKSLGIEMDVTGVAKDSYGKRSITEVDLNTVLKDGKYYCVNCNNRPININGYLEVFGNASAYCYQIYSPYSSSSIYTRKLVDGSWWGWTHLIDPNVGKWTKVYNPNTFTCPSGGGYTQYPITSLHSGFGQLTVNADGTVSPVENGEYLVMVKGNFVVSSYGSRRQLALYLDGVVQQQDVQFPSSSAYPMMQVSHIYTLYTGSKLSVQCQQDSGSTLVFAGNIVVTKLRGRIS